MNLLKKLLFVEIKPSATNWLISLLLFAPVHPIGVAIAVKVASILEIDLLHTNIGSSHFFLTNYLILTYSIYLILLTLKFLFIKFRIPSVSMERLWSLQVKCQIPFLFLYPILLMTYIGIIPSIFVIWIFSFPVIIYTAVVVIGGLLVSIDRTTNEIGMSAALLAYVPFLIVSGFLFRAEISSNLTPVSFHCSNYPDDPMCLKVAIDTLSDLGECTQFETAQGRLECFKQFGFKKPNQLKIGDPTHLKLCVELKQELGAGLLSKFNCFYQETVNFRGIVDDTPLTWINLRLDPPAELLPQLKKINLDFSVRDSKSKVNILRSWSMDISRMQIEPSPARKELIDYLFGLAPKELFFEKNVYGDTPISILQKANNSHSRKLAEMLSR